MPHRCVLPENMSESMPGCACARSKVRNASCRRYDANRRYTPSGQDPPTAPSTAPSNFLWAHPKWELYGRHRRTARVSPRSDGPSFLNCLPTRPAQPSLIEQTMRLLLCLAPRAEVALIGREAAGMLYRISASWQGVPRGTAGKCRPLSRARAATDGAATVGSAALECAQRRAPSSPISLHEAGKCPREVEGTAG
jgi:hypothetical protein